MSQSQKEAAEYAEVLMAYSRGETIQMRRNEDSVTDEWSEITYPLWDFGRFEYRVAPKPVDFWVWRTPNQKVYGFSSSREKLVNEYGRYEGGPIRLREVIE